MYVFSLCYITHAHRTNKNIQMGFIYAEQAVVHFCTAQKPMKCRSFDKCLVFFAFMHFTSEISFA